MHAPALALADPVCFPEELRHHPVDVHALADALAVAAVRGVDEVLRLEGGTDARARGLFTDAEVRRAVNLSKAEQAHRCFLEGPAERHLLVHVEQFFTRELQADPLLAYAIICQVF